MTPLKGTPLKRLASRASLVSLKYKGRIWVSERNLDPLLLVLISCRSNGSYYLLKGVSIPCMLLK